MKLYDPVTGAYLLICLLTFAFSGELFTVFSSDRTASCHKANSALQSESKQGPLNYCK